MRELTVHEIELVAGGATVWQAVGQGAIVGAVSEILTERDARIVKERQQMFFPPK